MSICIGWSFFPDEVFLNTAILLFVAVSVVLVNFQSAHQLSQLFVLLIGVGVAPVMLAVLRGHFTVFCEIFQIGQAVRPGPMFLSDGVRESPFVQMSLFLVYSRVEGRVGVGIFT